MLIYKLIQWELLIEDLQNHVPAEIKIHLFPIVKRLEALCKHNLDCSQKWVATSLLLVEACLDKTWEVLNSGYWKDVPIEYRYCYSLCTIIKTILMQLEYKDNCTEINNKKQSMLSDIINQIDKGILLGAALPSMPSLLTTIASKLSHDSTIDTQINSTDLIINAESFSETIFPGCSKIHEYEEPSMESFYRDIFSPKRPAVLKGCISHWRALKLWKNLDYLNKVAGSRTVPIEIGSRYTEEDWTQHLVNFSEFVQKHISMKSEKIGYLAQHQLFEQIPELKDDFAIPEYCNFSENEEAEQPDINVWFGPGGTVSPLHFDPKNNLLCQVFGYKRVILYHPDDSANLYPYDTRLLNNTAQVDPTNPDYEKWPRFSQAKGMMCYLKPGEMLYIPPKWWHHVTALTPSFSISFWWC